MSREHDPVRFGTRWLAALRLRLSRALPGASVRARMDHQSDRLQAVEEQLTNMSGTLHALERAADLRPLLTWVRGAEAHLAALQADHEILRKLHLEERLTDPGPVLEWVRGAEAHLAALQAGHEHLAAMPERHAAQLERVIARAAALEARIADLEQLDTEIVLTLARSLPTGRL